jgi:hypothetical protein
MPNMGAGGEGGGGILDFLRDNPQFQAIRAMVQGNPQILQPMLAELQRQGWQHFSPRHFAVQTPIYCSNFLTMHIIDDLIDQQISF